MAPAAKEPELETIREESQPTEINTISTVRIQSPKESKKTQTSRQFNQEKKNKEHNPDNKKEKKRQSKTSLRISKKLAKRIKEVRPEELTLIYAGFWEGTYSRGGALRAPPH